jgi:hypothetical protein
MLGAGSTIIVIVALVCGHAPKLLIIHCNTLVPSATAVTVVFGLFELVITALPLITDQVPTPEVGVLAANVVVGFKTQSVWLGPAFAILGAGFTIMVIVEFVNGHAPLLLMLHSKTFVPRLNPLTVVVGLFGLLNIPEPETTDHVPNPEVGVFAANVVVGFRIHIV